MMMNQQKFQQAMFEQQFGQLGDNWDEAQVEEVNDEIRFQEDNPFQGQSELIAKAKELVEMGEV